jgi:hypothetical protein
MKLAPAVTASFLFAFLTGCLSPSVRYSRSPVRVESTPKGETRVLVPPDWDYRNSYRIPVDKLKTTIDSYLGTPYRWAGTTRKGMDCSGFVQTVFREVCRADLPRSSRAMSDLGRRVPLTEARPGDLVFFRGGLFNRINHVGIYLGDGRFAHASSKKGVTISRLENQYFRTHLAAIRRVL